MANNYWLGGAAKIKQTRTFVFAATWEATDIIRVTIGTRSYDFVAGSTVIATVGANLVTAWAALSRTLFPEFYEVVPSFLTATLTLTARTEGVPFTVTLLPLETNGATSDSQTIEGGTSATTGTAGVSNSSPWDGSVAANWSDGVPTDGDVLIFKDSAVDLLDGLDLSAINVDVIQYMSYTGKIGRPPTNPAGYPEYRRTYLRIGTDDSPAQTVTLGLGSGTGSGRIKIDAGASATTFIVQNAGTAADPGFPAVMLKGTDAANVLTHNKGAVGFAVGGYDVAAAAEETGTLATVNLGYVSNQNGDAVLGIGSGVATITAVNQSGGRLETRTGATTITKTGGELTLAGTGVTVTTLNLQGGNVFVTSTTTITTATVGGTGHLDFSRDMRAKTVTNPIDLYGADCLLTDTFNVVASLVVDCNQGALPSQVRLGPNRRLTVAAAA